MAEHLVPNVLAKDLRILFCGTAPSSTSAAMRAYYAFPQNKFWKTLELIGLTPTQLMPGEYLRLLEFGIGLTDLCKVASGNDDELPKGSLDTLALRKIIEKYRPTILAFTSKTAGKAFCGNGADYGWQQEVTGTTKIFILPSTSPRARRYWDIQWWHALADEASKL